MCEMENLKRVHDSIKPPLWSAASCQICLNPVWRVACEGSRSELELSEVRAFCFMHKTVAVPVGAAKPRIAQPSEPYCYFENSGHHSANPYPRTPVYQYAFCQWSL